MSLRWKQITYDFIFSLLMKGEEQIVHVSTCQSNLQTPILIPLPAPPSDLLIRRF